jgi:SAM-dependent methyltransferase
MHVNCLALFMKHALPYFGDGDRVLEIGPDKFPSSLQVSAPSGAWDTLDICLDTRLTYSSVMPYIYPIPDHTYDVVVSANVAEHVPFVWSWMAEQTRVCKRGGYVVVVCPAVRHYHEVPVDCWRIYPQGGITLLEYAGLVPVRALSASYKGDVMDTIFVGRKP